MLKKSRYSFIHQNNLTDMEILRNIDMEILRNIDIPLVLSLLTLKRLFSWLNLGNGCQLCWLAEIKLQTIKNYETCKHRYKLHHVNQKSQSTRWKETCIEFKKYADCRFWANTYEVYWNFRSVRIISL